MLSAEYLGRGCAEGAINVDLKDKFSFSETAQCQESDISFSYHKGLGEPDKVVGAVRPLLDGLHHLDPIRVGIHFALFGDPVQDIGLRLARVVDHRGGDNAAGSHHGLEPSAVVLFFDVG